MPADDVIRVSILADVQNAVAGFGKAALAAGVTYLSLRKLVDIGKVAIDAFLESEKAQARLAAALKITGQASQSTISSISKYAQELQKLTGFEDEATVEAAGLLIQLGGLTEKGVKKALPLVQDFAAVMGMDLVQAATLVGKTLGTSTNALSRQLGEIEKNLSPSEKFAAVMEKLESKAGGFAKEVKEMSKTGGSLQDFRNALDEIAEYGGSILSKVLAPMTQWFADQLNKIGSHMAKMSDLADLGKRFNTGGELNPYEMERFIGYNLTVIRDREKVLNEQIARLQRSKGPTIDKTIAERYKELNALKDVEREYDKLYRKAQNEINSLSATPAGNVLTGYAGGDEDLAATAQKNRLAEATDWLSDSQRAYNQDIENGKVSLDAYNAAMWTLEQRLTGGTGGKGSSAGGVGSPLGRQGGLLRISAEDAETWVEKYVESLKKIDKANEEAAERTRVAWENAFSSIEDVMGRLGAISDQYYRNQEAAVDNEYEKRRDTIEATVTDETQKAAALAALDDEFETRRKQIMHDQAVAEKTFGIFNTLIDTAQAIAKTLATLPAPANWIMAGVVGALGAAQTALIAAQPVPALARGGEFDVPPGYPADSYQMRVSSGEHVSVSPAGGGQRIIINLDGRAIADFVTKGTRDRRIIVDAGSVA